MSEFKDALDAWNDPRFTKGGFALAHNDTIRRALLIADRLMMEPSKSMANAGCRYVITKTGHIWCFKAMRAVMLKEIENV